MAGFGGAAVAGDSSTAKCAPEHGEHRLGFYPPPSRARKEGCAGALSLLAAMSPEAPIEPSRLTTWGKRILKGAVVVVAAWFTWRFVTHTDFEWSRLAERVEAARAPFVA